MDMVTAATPIHNQADVDDPSVVKAVLDQAQARSIFRERPFPISEKPTKPTL